MHSEIGITMIDRNLLRDNVELVRTKIAIKDPDFDLDGLIAADHTIREIQTSVENLRHTKNEYAKAAQKGITPELRAASIEVGKQLKAQEDALVEAEKNYTYRALRCPNIPLDDVPVGNKESNKVVRTFGEKPTFSFTPRNHVDLALQNKWLDFETANRMAGAGFPFYRKDGMAMIYALSMYMLKHNVRHGFEPMLPPYVVNEQALMISGNFPKFAEQAYSIPGDGLYLTPTAEVNLTNIYKDTILQEEQLPIRMTSWTPCFRREAGSYGAHERGLIRIHQFDKVELVTVCKPEESPAELERIVNTAETILQSLGLHYRVCLLAGQDTGFQSAKTYDIEVWLPGQGEYREVSSCSSCTDFQARRGGIRYKNSATQKNQLVHTLNGSSLALPRLMVALLETYQKEDGTVEMPEVLKPYLPF
jgi:seryl-tRNA synthetase